MMERHDINIEPGRGPTIHITTAQTISHFGSRIWSSVSNGSQNCPKSRTLTMQDLWNYLKAMHRGVSHTGRPSLRMRRSWWGQSKPTIRASRTMTSHLRWEKTLNTLPPNWNGHTSGPIAWGKGGECYVWRFLVLRYIIIRANNRYSQDGHRPPANGGYKELKNAETSAWAVWTS